MAYYKDPNVEKLYDIANKSNVKRGQKKQELLNEFDEVLTNVVKDINVPSRRTFTFNDKSHLLNVALSKGNLWVSNFILDKYKEKIDFDSIEKLVSFLILYSRTGNAKIFKHFFNDERLKDINKFIEYNSKHTFTYDIIFMDADKNEGRIKNHQDFLQHLTASSILNSDRSIYDYLEQKKILDHSKVANSWQYTTSLWFIESNHELINKNPDLRASIQKIDDHHLLSLKNLLNQKVYTSNQVGSFIARCDDLDYRDSKHKEIIKFITHIEKTFRNDKEVIKPSLKDFLHSHSIYKTNANFESFDKIKKLSDDYLSINEIIDIYLTRINNNYQFRNIAEVMFDSSKTNEKTLTLCDEYNVHWDAFNLLIQNRDSIEVADELRKNVVPLLKDANSRDSWNIRYERYINHLLESNSHLSLNKDFDISFGKIYQSLIRTQRNRTGENQEVVDYEILQLLKKAKNHMYEEQHNSFLENVSFLDTPGFDEHNATQTIRQHFGRHSPWIRFYKFPEVQKAVLESMDSHDSIIKELMYMKHSTLYNWMINKKDDMEDLNQCQIKSNTETDLLSQYEKEQKMYSFSVQYFDNLIDLFINSPDLKLSTSKASILLAEKELCDIVSDIDKEQLSSKKYLTLYEIITQRYHLNNDSEELNIAKPKKRL